NVDVVIFEVFLVYPEFAGSRLGVRVCRLGRFLHHLADLSRESELTLALGSEGLDKHYVAAYSRPGQPRNDAYLVFLQCALDMYSRHPQILPYIFRGHAHRREISLLGLGLLPCYLATDLPDLAFELSEAGFLRVFADYLRQRLTVEFNVRL